MTNPTKLVICCGGCEPKCGNCGVAVEVEMTDAEVAQAEQDAINSAAAQAAREAAMEAHAALKTSAKAKLIAGTPLTEEEAATIVL
jgi:hypothetical protein